jgi:ABC-type transport system involved in multi-copper enzyme maturation permease subunit
MGGSSLLEHLWAPYFGQINMILLFTSPFFVSRLFSEEKRQDCMLSLLASPLGSLEICLQKFMAGWTILLAFLGLAFFFPLASLALFKSPYLPEVFSGMLALVLASALYAAISLFSGILFSSLFMSGIFSVVINLSLWSIGIIFRDLISFRKMEWVEQFWIGKYLTDLFVANLSSLAVYFFLAASCFFLFLSYQLLEEVERG